MKRILYGVMLAGVVLAAFAVRALADAGLTGNWTVSLLEQGKQHTFWLVKLAEKEGKVTGTSESADNVPSSSIDGLGVDGDVLHFTITVRGTPFDFQGKVPKGETKKILGSIARGSLMIPAQLERTTAKDLKGKEVTRDIAPKLPKELDTKALTELKDNPFLFEVTRELLREAGAKKAETATVREWVDLVTKAAAAYGPRWQQEVALRTAEALAGEKQYAPLAEKEARQALAEKAMDSETKLRALTTLATALKKEGKEEYAKVAASVDALELELYKEHSKEALPFTPDKFGGRKEKSDRAVLVELFTGAQCPPCVAADLAFDALGKTYSPKEVVLLQYHLHIPGPDPLTNPGTLARLKYYSKEVEGTPTILFNGKTEAGGGGFVPHAKGKYTEYRGVVDPLLEKPAAVKLEATAVRKGDKIDITATASGVDKPGEKVRLRLALVEEWVHYRGGNGLSYHHHVVRNLPGGAEGLALTKETGKQEATVDLDALRTKLGTYLEDFVKNEGPFPSSSWPLGLRDLRVVAFVQNDESKEVLQAVEVAVR